MIRLSMVFGMMDDLVKRVRKWGYEVFNDGYCSIGYYIYLKERPENLVERSICLMRLFEGEGFDLGCLEIEAKFSPIEEYSFIGVLVR